MRNIEASNTTYDVEFHFEREYVLPEWWRRYAPRMLGGEKQIAGSNSRKTFYVDRELPAKKLTFKHHNEDMPIKYMPLRVRADAPGLKVTNIDGQVKTATKEDNMHLLQSLGVL